MVPLLWASCHHDVTGCCCPLFAAVVGSVSCCWFHVSCCAFRFRLFCGFRHPDGLRSLHTGLTLRAPCGVVCVFFSAACHAFSPVGFFRLACLSVGVSVFVFMVVFIGFAVFSAGCCLLVVGFLFCWLVFVVAFPRGLGLFSLFCLLLEFGCRRVRKCEVWFFPCFWAGWLSFRKQKLFTWANTCDIGWLWRGFGFFLLIGFLGWFPVL